MLGSVRAATDQSGATLARHDYFAFGEDAGPGPATGPERQRFTGKERDSETFFDYFNARYYRNVIGRFTTIDPGQASASLDDPQGWNAYAYCRNNPLRFVDPDGRDYLVTTDQYDDKGKFIGIQYSWIDSDDEWEAALRNPGVPGIEYSEGDIRGGGIFGIFERGKAVGTFQHFDKMGRFAREITDKAGALEEPRTYVEFGALAVGGGAVGASTPALFGTRGLITGTRYMGNRPWLNSNDYLRIGWSKIRDTGEWTFRVGGKLIEKLKNNPHINLWPPSWWFK